MGAKELRRERAARRIVESAIATVLGGLILWSMTSSMSQPSPATERMAVAAAPAVQPVAEPARFAPPPCEAPPLLMELDSPMPVSIPGPAVVNTTPKAKLRPSPIPVGSVLLSEDFSRYREGTVTGWGPNTFVKLGLDHRNWLVSNVEGTHPVGCKMPLPGVFSFQCRYAVYMPEVTRGLLGWWKEPVSTAISFSNDQGSKCIIEWAIRFGNDPTQLNPLGSSSLYVKKYYHTIKLADGSSNEIGVIQASGVLRIDRNANVIKVFLDGQSAAAGTVAQAGQLAGFEINVVNVKSGTLFFTDFKITR
jgi:hypothetical protein